MCGIEQDSLVTGSSMRLTEAAAVSDVEFEIANSCCAIKESRVVITAFTDSFRKIRSLASICRLAKSIVLAAEPGIPADLNVL